MWDISDINGLFIFILSLLFILLPLNDGIASKIGFPVLTSVIVIYAGFLILTTRKEKKLAKEKANHYFTALKRSFGSPYPSFNLQDAERQYLIEHDFSAEAIYYHLIIPIMNHLNVPFAMFNVNVIDGGNSSTAGCFPFLIMSQP